MLNELKKCIPFKAVRNRSVTLTCEDCKSVKKSLSGFASHVIFCNKTASVSNNSNVYVKSIVDMECLVYLNTYL